MSTAPQRPLDEILRLRERARAAERTGARGVVISHPDWDPVPLAAAAIDETETVPIVVGMRLERTHPFLAARALTTLDHLSHGRVGLLADTQGLSDADAREFLAAVDALWQSWAPDAEVQDAATGVFADADRVRPVNFAGARYRTRGPLNLPHAPQPSLPVWSAPGGALASRADRWIDDDEAARVRFSIAVILRGAKEDVA